MSMATLEAIVADPETVRAYSSVKTGLFGVFHRLWASPAHRRGCRQPRKARFERRAQWRLQGLQPQLARGASAGNVGRGFAFGAIRRDSGPSTQAGGPTHGARSSAPGREWCGLVHRRVLDHIEDEGDHRARTGAIVEGSGHKVAAGRRARAQARSVCAIRRPECSKNPDGRQILRYRRWSRKSGETGMTWPVILHHAVFETAAEPRTPERVPDTQAKYEGRSATSRQGMFFASTRKAEKPARPFPSEQEIVLSLRGRGGCHAGRVRKKKPFRTRVA